MLTEDSIAELIAEAHANGLSVHVTIHDVPAGRLYDWLERELIGPIGKGAQGNPPTSHGERPGGDVLGALHVTAFMVAGDVPELEPAEVD